MDTPTRRLLYRMYRSKNLPQVAAFLTAAGILLAIQADQLTFGNKPAYIVLRLLTAIATLPFAIAFITTTYTRVKYRLNPICKVCGIDEVDCKINRDSLSAHEPEPR